MKLFGIDLQIEALGDLGNKTHAFRRQPRVLGSGFRQFLEPDDLDLRCLLVRFAVGQDVLRQRYGAIKRALQTWQGLGNRRVSGVGEAIGGHLCRGQHITQVMIDLGNGLPQCRQAGARTQGQTHLILHRGHFALDLANFIGPIRRFVRCGGVFRVGLETDNALGQLPDRPHDKHRQADKDEETGEE